MVCIVDEAHCLRNRTARMQMTILKMKMSNQLFLLTGTPLLNEASDVLLWTQLFDVGGIGTIDHIGSTDEAIDLLHEHLNVMYFKPGKENESHYPTVVRETVEIPMHWYQVLHYFKYMSGYVVFGDHEFQSSHKNHYQSQSKQICNGVRTPSATFLSPKIDFLVEAFLRVSYPFPWVIYSGYLETGVDEIYDRLLNNNRSIARITGATDADGRQRTVGNYNRGLVDVLLLSQVGSEGINLMGTGTLFLTTRHANDAAAAQTQSRAIRYDSHKQSLFNTVKIVDIIMQFPSVDPSSEELTMMANDPWMMGEQMDGQEVYSILCQKIKDADGVTIEQRMHRENALKTESLKHWINAFRAIGSFANTKKRDTREPIAPKQSATSKGSGGKKDAKRSMN
jgi:hypothetical protein